MKLQRKTRTLFPLAAALVLAIFTACEDNPVDEGHDHGDEDPVAMEIRTETGDEVVHADAGGVTGEITVAEGTETDHLEVVFLAEDGDEIDPGDEHFLQVDVVEGADIAAIEQHEPGEFEIHVLGLKAGEARLEFKYMHGAPGSGDAHFHFKSPPVHVHVTAAQ